MEGDPSSNLVMCGTSRAGFVFLLLGFAVHLGIVLTISIYLRRFSIKGFVEDTWFRIFSGMSIYCSILSLFLLLAIFGPVNFLDQQIPERLMNFLIEIGLWYSVLMTGPVLLILLFRFAVKELEKQ